MSEGQKVTETVSTTETEKFIEKKTTWHLPQPIVDVVNNFADAVNNLAFLSESLSRFIDVERKVIEKRLELLETGSLQDTKRLQELERKVNAQETTIKNLGQRLKDQAQRGGSWRDGKSVRSTSSNVKALSVPSANNTAQPQPAKIEVEVTTHVEGVTASAVHQDKLNTSLRDKLSKLPKLHPATPDAG